MKRVFLLAFLVLPLLLFSTAQVEAKSKDCKKGDTGKVIGAVVGGVLGGLLGRKIDGGNNRTAGTIVGTVIGGLAGSALGKSLDKCEREKLDDATNEALNDTSAKGASKPVTWTSDTREGVHGSVTAGAPAKLADGRECRTTTRVAYINGEEVIEQPRLCRQPPNTQWTVA